MVSLTDIISRGQTVYEATLPDYLRRQEAPEASRVNITMTDERQREICLNCPLADCAGIESPACPIQIEQRRIWREKNRRREVDKPPRA